MKLRNLMDVVKKPFVKVAAIATLGLAGIACGSINVDHNFNQTVNYAPNPVGSVSENEDQLIEKEKTVEEESRFSFSGDASLTGATSYVASGFVIQEDPVLQAGAGITINDDGTGASLRLGTWADYATENVLADGKASFDEVDLTAEATIPITDNVTASLGIAQYHFPRWLTSEEVTANISLSDPFGLEGLTTTVSGARDIHKIGGGKITFATEYNHDLGKLTGVDLFDGVTTSVSGDLTHNNKYYTEKSGLSHWTAGTRINIPLTESLSTSIGYTHSHSLRDDFKSKGYGSLGLGFNFDFK